MYAVGVAVLLVILSCFGIILLFSAKWPWKSSSPFFITLVLFDMMTVLSGPMVFLISAIVKRPLFSDNSISCYAVEIWHSYSINGSIFACLFLALNNRKERLYPQPRYWVRINLILSLLFPMIPSCFSLFARLPWYINCLSLINVTSGDINSILEVLTIIVPFGIVAITVRLAFIGQGIRKYNLNVKWKHHRKTMRSFSPECSTYNTSESSFDRISMNSLNNLNRRQPFVIPYVYQGKNTSLPAFDNNVFIEKVSPKNIPSFEPRIRHDGQSQMPGFTSPLPEIGRPLEPRRYDVTSYRDTSKLKQAKWVLTADFPGTWEQEKKEWQTKKFKRYVYIATWFSLIGWIWMGVFFALKLAVGMTEEVWIISTWLVYLKVPLSCYLFKCYFTEEALSMFRSWFHRRNASQLELSFELESKTARSKAVKLNRLSMMDI